MSTYMVALVRPNEATWAKIKSEWPDRHHFVSDAIAFIAIPKEGVATPSSIVKTIGISSDAKDASGVVTPIEVPGAAGTLPMAAIEWLQAAGS